MPELFLFAFTTSIATPVENDQAAGAVLYPNPASDLLHVSGMDVASVKIYSLTGQLVKEVLHTAVVDVSDMETGIYVVSVTDRQNNSIRKMTVIE